MRRVNEDENLPFHIAFTDESSYKLSEEPNKQNHRMWAVENPHNNYEIKCVVSS